MKLSCRSSASSVFNLLLTLTARPDQREGAECFLFFLLRKVLVSGFRRGEAPAGCRRVFSHPFTHEFPRRSVNTANKSDRDRVNCLHFWWHLTPMRFDAFGGHIQPKWLNIAVSGKQEVAKKPFMGRLRLPTDALVYFSQVFSHEGWRQDRAYPNILCWGSTNILGDKIKSKLY